MTLYIRKRRGRWRRLFSLLIDDSSGFLEKGKGVEVAGVDLQLLVYEGRVQQLKLEVLGEAR